MGETSNRSTEHQPSLETQQLLQVITNRALTTDIGPLLAETFPNQSSRIAIEAVRSYKVNPLEEASNLITSRLRKTNLALTYQRLVNANSPTLHAFLDFFADMVPNDPHATQSIHERAFTHLATLSLAEIGAEMGKFLADQLLTNPDINLVQTETSLESFFDFVLPEKARPYAHAAMAIEREARQTQYYTIGRALEKVYKIPNAPENQQPHFTFANQDALLVLQLPIATGEEVLLMVGADGITLDGIDKTGIGHSQEVSHKAVLLLAQKVRRMTEVTPKKLADAFDDINREIWADIYPQQDRFLTQQTLDTQGNIIQIPLLPGSTLFAVALMPEQAVWSSVGDSSIVYDNQQQPLRRLNAAETDRRRGSLVNYIGRFPSSDISIVTLDNADTLDMHNGDTLLIHSDGIRAATLQELYEDAKALHPEAFPQCLADAAIEVQKDNRLQPRITQTADETGWITIPIHELSDDACIAIARRKTNV